MTTMMMMMIGSGRIMDGGARSSSGKDAASREGIQLSDISNKFSTYLSNYNQYFS